MKLRIRDILFFVIGAVIGSLLLLMIGMTTGGQADAVRLSGVPVEAKMSSGIVTGEHCSIEYSGVDEKWPSAFAAIYDTVYTGYKDIFGFLLPSETYINITITGETTRLWTDGKNSIFLQLASEDDLQPTSPYKNIYGMCHEPGHIVMYSRMSSLAGLPDGVAEGWAHYSGSIITDYVWQKLGESAYPVPYDYSVSGALRLRKQCDSADKDAVTLAACSFFALGEQHGHDMVGHAMREALAGKPSGGELMLRFAEAINALAGESAADLIPDKLLVSTVKWETERFAKGEIPPPSFFEGLMADENGWIHYDDDSNEGIRSVAGSGHAVLFSVRKGSKLASVAMKGGRYGLPHSDSIFRISVLNAEFESIIQLEFPFMRYAGRTQEVYWQEFDTERIEVPEVFFVTFDFNPTATDGIYVGIDESTKGHSFYALPEDHIRSFDAGDWMIRVRMTK